MAEERQSITQDELLSLEFIFSAIGLPDKLRSLGLAPLLAGGASF